LSCNGQITVRSPERPNPRQKTNRGAVKGGMRSDLFLAKFFCGERAFAFRAAGEIFRQLPSNDREAVAHASFDQHRRQNRRRRSNADAEQFLVGVLAVFVEDARAPFGLAGAGPFAASLVQMRW